MYDNSFSLDPVSADCYVWYDTEPMKTPVYHYHNGYELHFLVKGNAHFSVEDSRFEVGQGSILLIRPWEKHSVESYGNEYYERYAVHVSHDLLEKLSTQNTNLLNGLFNRPIGKPHFLSVNREEQENLLKILQALYETYQSDCFGKDVLCNAYIARLCVFINEKLLEKQTIKLPNTMPELVVKTMKYIDDHIEERISQEDLEKELYHNGTYIARCFKKATGLSVMEYILRKRIRQSQEYLIRGYQVADSGQRAGFYDASNFTRTFTKYVGITPKEYQRRAQENRISH